MGNSSDIDISIASLYQAWRLFRKGKRYSPAITVFEYNLETELLSLQHDLVTDTYTHGGYEHFTVNDTKRRNIAVASVRDRVVHRLLYEYLVPIVDKQFAYQVWSCRQDKGLLGAIEVTARAMSRYRNGWLWRGDVCKFFDSVDHTILLSIIRNRIPGEQAYAICEEVIGSYAIGNGTGIAIGNLTSQILANVYLNEFDRFVLHTLKPCAYIRYGDDFILWYDTGAEVVFASKQGEVFLDTQLKLQLQPANTCVQRVDRKLHYLGIEFFYSGYRLDARNRQKLTGQVSLINQASYRALAIHHMPTRYRRAFAWQCLAYHETLFEIGC